MENEVTIREVMSREYVGVSESDSVLGAVQLMRDEASACVIVLRGSEPVGIVTEWDVLGLVADELDPETTEIAAIMSSPVVTVDPDRGLSEAAETMGHEGIRNLLVTEADDIVGVLTQRDVIAATGSMARSMNGQTATLGTEPEPRAASANPARQAAGDRVGFERQGICEVCGSLSHSLVEENGQLVCADCRGV
ncbi:MAG: CBS domain-containing protein [Halobacteriales archaeon]|jgi:CBS domain-containing protein